jgi:hypothetical protein
MPVIIRHLQRCTVHKKHFHLSFYIATFAVIANSKMLKATAYVCE